MLQVNPPELMVRISLEAQVCLSELVRRQVSELVHRQLQQWTTLSDPAGPKADIYASLLQPYLVTTVPGVMQLDAA